MEPWDVGSYGKLPIGKKQIYFPQLIYFLSVIVDVCDIPGIYIYI